MSLKTQPSDGGVTVNQAEMAHEIENIVKQRINSEVRLPCSFMFLIHRRKLYFVTELIRVLLQGFMKILYKCVFHCGFYCSMWSLAEASYGW